MKFSQFIEDGSLSFSSPIDKEEWDRITDVELEKTEKITFRTPSGKEVPFRKVKYGEWKQVGRFQFACSNCGFDDMAKTSNFCPNCGASMMDKKTESELTNAEIYEMFCECGIHPIDYRPLDINFVEGKKGITIFCVNGDILFYFPNKERKKING